MNIQRGEIWVVRLDPTLGDEIQKTRPAVVVSNDALGVLALRTVAPITSWRDEFASMDWLVKIMPTPSNGLQKPSAVDTFQLRALSVRRFVRRTGSVESSLIKHIEEAIKMALDLS